MSNVASCFYSIRRDAVFQCVCLVLIKVASLQLTLLHPKINICQGGEALHLVNSYIFQDIFQDNVNCLKKMFLKMMPDLIPLAKSPCSYSYSYCDTDIISCITIKKMSSIFQHMTPAYMYNRDM